MKEEKRRWLLGSYLRQYRATACMFLLFIGVFTMIFSLYTLETEAVLYAAGLCVLLALSVLIAHFFFYCKKHRRRKAILQNIQLMTDRLPEPQNLMESDYQEMLRALKQILDTNMTAWQNQRRESIDYYTTWVHQIKTPISVMRMLLQGEDTAEHRELLAELFRIEQYVDMVLSYLRLGGDVSDFVIREYDLDNIIRQAVHKYAPQFIRRRIRLSYEPTGLTVLTDEKWLLFIVEQLLSNAVKYTQEGAVSIAVTQDKILNISDNGIGIAPEDLPRVFEKGFTGYNGRADKKSTGLGLYLCRLAADKLSHKISIKSTVGAGTVVSIDLHTDALEVE